MHGRVQGVGYRYFARQQAEALGISGFVRNLPDGGVEVCGEGSEQALAQFEECLRRGPSFAVVNSLEKLPLEPRGALGFHIR